MTFQQLRYFIAVAKYGSFTKAAKRCHVSQPSISKMIKDMEEKLGVVLFHRDKKGVILTDAGDAVYQQAQEIINSYKNLTEVLSDVTKFKKGTIKIGIPPIVGAVFFPKILGDFIQRYPGIELKLKEVGSRTIESAVKTGDLDIGIICSAPKDTNAFEMIPLLKDPLMLVLYPEHPLANQKSIELGDLKNQKFILYSEDFSLYDQIISACQLAGFFPQVACRSSQRDFMTEMVVAKLGIALLSKTICRELDSKRLKAVPLKGDPVTLNLMIIYKKGTYQSFAVREWLSFTVARVKSTKKPSAKA